MIKRYKANTTVSVNVVLPSKKNLHVAFYAKSNGSSTYVTDNEDIQNALERHYQYGKLFRLDSKEEGTLAAKAEEAKVAKEEAKKETEEPKVKQVKVSDISKAREYLSEHFGISRTMIRSMAAVKKYAAQNNIEFIGLE